jgi:hypothetical protein
VNRVARGDAGYEDARRQGIWQTLKPERYPAVIVRPADADAAADAVRAAIR